MSEIVTSRVDIVLVGSNLQVTTQWKVRAMTVFDEIQSSITRLASEAGSSVVGIGQRWGIGSGIVLSEGRVLTNAHNVRGNEVTVTFADGRTAEGTVTGHDVDGDLAVIEVDTGQAPALASATDAPATGAPAASAAEASAGAWPVSTSMTARSPSTS